MAFSILPETSRAQNFKSRVPNPKQVPNGEADKEVSFRHPEGRGLKLFKQPG